VTIEDEERSISDTSVHITPQDRRAHGLTIRFAENEAGGDETILLLRPGHFAWEDSAEDYLRLTGTWIDARRITRSGG
jgi:hypothetical protein